MTSTAVGYNLSTQEWVSFDTPDTIALKVALIEEKGLLGGMFWAIDDDEYQWGEKYPNIRKALEFIKSIKQNNRGVMFNLVTAAVGGHMAAKMDPKKSANSVMSAFEESRVVSTVLELVATLYGNSVSSLPTPIFLHYYLFTHGAFWNRAVGSNCLKKVNLIKHLYFFKGNISKLFRLLFFSLAFLGSYLESM